MQPLHTIKALLLLILAAPLAACASGDGWTTIKNGNLWTDTDGRTVQAHAPGIIREGATFYMVGEDRGDSWNPDVNLYASDDLVHWRFVKKIIANHTTDSLLGRSRMIERAKLMRCPATGRYVVWCHYEAKDYSASEAACFSSATIDGTYTKDWAGRPCDTKSRDCNVFVDEDATAYFISTTNENTDLGLFRLSPDYSKAVSHTPLFEGHRREAPVIVKKDGLYYMVSSACSGWDPNQQMVATSRNLTEGWSELRPVGNQVAWDTQAAAILKVAGTLDTTFLYIGDRWMDPGLPETKTIVFPVEFHNGQMTFDYRERFDINFTTGQWRETPTEKVFVDKRKWKVSKGEGIMPRVTIDLGKRQTITGFVTHPHPDAPIERKFELCVSNDGQQWKSVYNTQWLPYGAEVDLHDTIKARYVSFTTPNIQLWTASEIDFIQ